jgi:hypothetical protein
MFFRPVIFRHFNIYRLPGRVSQELRMSPLARWPSSPPPTSCGGWGRPHTRATWPVPLAGSRKPTDKASGWSTVFLSSRGPCGRGHCPGYEEDPAAAGWGGQAPPWHEAYRSAQGWTTCPDLPTLGEGGRAVPSVWDADRATPRIRSSTRSYTVKAVILKNNIDSQIALLKVHWCSII